MQVIPGQLCPMHQSLKKCRLQMVAIYAYMRVPFRIDGPT